MTPARVNAGNEARISKFVDILASRSTSASEVLSSEVVRLHCVCFTSVKQALITQLPRFYVLSFHTSSMSSISLSLLFPLLKNCLKSGGIRISGFLITNSSPLPLSSLNTFNRPSSVGITCDIHCLAVAREFLKQFLEMWHLGFQWTHLGRWWS